MEQVPLAGGGETELAVHAGSQDPAARLDRAQAEQFVLATIAKYADGLLGSARRLSLCDDDAHDAYQRTMEIFVRRATTVDPERVGGWLHTIIRREAASIRAARLRLVAVDPGSLDDDEARDLPSLDDRVISFERVHRSAAALSSLKPHEVRALWLKASGRSYAEIAGETGWSATKVNRCLTEGRRRFLARYAGLEAGDDCDRWQPAISRLVDGEARAADVADLRTHLRACGACRATVYELRVAAPQLAAVFPGAGLAAIGGTDAADPGGALARLYEAFAHHVHDRAVSSALKVQGAMDALATGKVAAVAASAAAVAGGGAAVAERSDDHPIRPQARAAAKAVAKAAPGPAPRVIVRNAARPAVSQPQPRRTAKAEARRRRRAEFSSRSTSTGRAVVKREFAAPARSSTVTPPISPAPKTHSSSGVRNGAEFGF